MVIKQGSTLAGVLYFVRR